MAQDREELREKITTILEDCIGAVSDDERCGVEITGVEEATDAILAALPRTGEQDSEQMSKVRGFFRSGAQCLPRTGEPVLPEGFVAVPREPTEAMIEAGNNALASWVAPAMHSAHAYRAMIQAQADHIGEALQDGRDG